MNAQISLLVEPTSFYYTLIIMQDFAINGFHLLVQFCLKVLIITGKEN